MDRVAETLFREISQVENIYVELIRPKVRVFSLFPMFRANSTAINLDRFFNRFFLSHKLFRVRKQFDIFHIIDHSYNQLIHVLDPSRVLVTCHDLDTFKCLLEPADNPAGHPFRLMTSRILSGFRKASRVACDSHATLSGVLHYGLLPESRMHLCRMGVDDSFFSAFEDCCEPLPRTLIHIGSTIRRKRIDILLELF